MADTMAGLLARAEMMPHLCSRAELRHLWTCAMHAPALPMVECGVYLGSSAVVLADVAYRKQVPLVLIDNFSYVNAEYGPTSAELLRASLIRAGVPQLPRIVEGDSRVAPVDLAEVGFLHIDTDHRAVHLHAELDAWLPRMAAGSVIALHDYCEGSPEMIPVIDQRLGADPAWECLGLTRWTICFQRVPSPMAEVTVLTSVCGTASWLAEAVLSVLRAAAGGVDVELLVRANGEAEYCDVERIMCQVHADKCRVFYTDPTTSLSDSLNGMLAVASGEYVIRVDPDDALAPGGLRLLLEAARSGGPNAVANGSYRDFGERGGVYPVKPATPQALAQYSVGAYCYLARPELFRQAGGWREVGYEDWELLVRLMAAGGEYRMVPEVVLYHRVRSDGRMAEFSKTNAERIEAIRQANADWFRSQGVVI